MLSKQVHLPSPASLAQDPPARLLEPRPVPSDLRPLPGLRDAAEAFLFAGSTSSKTEQVSQRHTNTQTQRMPTWPVTQAATDKALRSAAPAYRTHINHKYRQPSPLLRFGWRGRMSLVQAHTHVRHSPGSQAHTHSWTLSVPTWTVCLLNTPAWIPDPLTHFMGPQLTG